MLKRTLSLVLALVMTVCLFASCELFGGKDAESIVAIADGELGKVDYTVNTQVVYSSTNEDLNAAIATMQSVNMTFAKKGHSSKSTASMGIADVEIEKEYLITAGVLYYTYTESKGTDVFAVKEKVNLNADERADIYEDIGMEAPLSYKDFENVEVNSSKGTYLITCDSLSIDATVAMEKLVKSNLGIDGADITVNNAELVISIVDGRYQSEDLEVNYIITLGDVSYDLKMQISREYDFTASVEINPPVDADKYIKTTYAELTK